MLKRVLYGALSLLLFCSPLLALRGESCNTEYCPLMAEMSRQAESSAEAGVGSSDESPMSEHCETSVAAPESPEQGDTLERTGMSSSATTAATLAAPRGMDCCWTDASPSPAIRSLVPVLGFSLDSPTGNLTLVGSLVSEPRHSISVPHRLVAGTPPPPLYSLHRALLI